MAKYQYEAKSFTGKMYRGTIEAKDEAEIRIKLRAKQLVPLKMRVLQGSEKNIDAVSFFNPKVKSKELQIFTRQFATLINAGIPILDSLKILSDGLKLCQEMVAEC